MVLDGTPNHDSRTELPSVQGVYSCIKGIAPGNEGISENDLKEKLGDLHSFNEAYHDLIETFRHSKNPIIRKVFDDPNFDIDELNDDKVSELIDVIRTSDTNVHYLDKQYLAIYDYWRSLSVKLVSLWSLPQGPWRKV
jgi:hypothetical protein